MQVTTTLRGSLIINGGIAHSDSLLEKILDKTMSDLNNPRVDTTELEVAVKAQMAKTERIKTKRAAKKAKKLKIAR